MARPNKPRWVCRMPGCKRFFPSETPNRIELSLSVEEYESIRLIDYSGYSQQKAAEQMGISRTSIRVFDTSF